MLTYYEPGIVVSFNGKDIVPYHEKEFPPTSF